MPWYGSGRSALWVFTLRYHFKKLCRVNKMLRQSLYESGSSWLRRNLFEAPKGETTVNTTEHLKMHRTANILICKHKYTSINGNFHSLWQSRHIKWLTNTARQINWMRLNWIIVQAILHKYLKLLLQKVKGCFQESYYLDSNAKHLREYLYIMCMKGYVKPANRVLQKLYT